MFFEPSKIWSWFTSKPKWARIFLFVFVIIAIVLAAIFFMFRKSPDAGSEVQMPMETMEGYLDAEAAAAQQQLKVLDDVVEKEKDWQEMLEEKKQRDHESAEGIRDEIRNAGSIADVTNALRKGRGE